MDQIHYAIGIGCQLTFAGAGAFGAYVAVSTAWPQRHRILAALRGDPISPASLGRPAPATALPQQRDVEAVTLPTSPARAALGGVA